MFRPSKADLNSAGIPASVMTTSARTRKMKETSTFSPEFRAVGEHNRRTAVRCHASFNKEFLHVRLGEALIQIDLISPQESLGGVALPVCFLDRQGPGNLLDRDRFHP
jgi:hypothetical protein